MKVDDEYRSIVETALDVGIDLRRQLRAEGVSPILVAGEIIVQALLERRRLFLCGNGGSAADCQHIAAELTGRFSSTPRRALPAIAITTDTSALTAIGNDLGFEHVFARQLEALAQPGDVLLVLSTSGNSRNVVRAVEAARQISVRVIALTGPSAGTLGPLADVIVAVPGATSDRIQELHITVGHIFCGIIERAMSR